LEKDCFKSRWIIFDLSPSFPVCSSLERFLRWEYPRLDIAFCGCASRNQRILVGEVMEVEVEDGNSFYKS